MNVLEIYEKLDGTKFNQSVWNCFEKIYTASTTWEEITKFITHCNSLDASRVNFNIVWIYGHKGFWNTITGILTQFDVETKNIDLKVTLVKNEWVQLIGVVGEKLKKNNNNSVTMYSQNFFVS